MDNLNSLGIAWEFGLAPATTTRAQALSDQEKESASAFPAVVVTSYKDLSVTFSHTTDDNGSF